MTSTPVAPAPTRLAGNVSEGEGILALVRDSLGCAGKDARGFTRHGIHVQTPGEVDAFAASWEVTPFWTDNHTQYVAHRYAPSRDAVAEVVYYAPAEAANEAAA